MRIPALSPVISRALFASVLPLVLLLSGCGGGSGTSSTPPVTSAPALTLSTASLTFAATAVGSGSAAQSVTLTNSGSAALTLNSIGLSDTTDYALTNACGASLAAGSSCSISITFTPKSAASLPATLTITDNASPATQTISISGTGSSSGAPALSLSTTSVTFISTAVGNTTTGTQLTLSNAGSATLTLNGIVLGDTKNFSYTTTCGSSIAAGSSCTVTPSFTPQSGGALSTSITITDNATPSTATISLSGTGLAPVVSLSPTSITFPNTTVGSTSAVSTVTLTNTGNAVLYIFNISWTDILPANFHETNNCGSSLAAGASCTLSVTFSPQAAQTYTSTISISDNAAGSAQTVSLSGTGTTVVVTRTLITFPASFPDISPDASVAKLYSLVNNATTSIDMTMYELVDTTFSGDLVAACNRGVKVRVLLDASLEKSSNTAAYNQLNTAGSNCSAVFSNTAFQATHEKSILIDGVTSVIMTLNLASRYYTTTRDFALIQNDSADYAAIEATFNMDWAAGTPYNGTQGASDKSYTPGAGDDLIWSPTTAQAAMLAIINNAKSTLLIENEELGSSTNSTIVAALSSACQRGVVVHFTIVDQSSYEAQFTTIKNAGCSVHTYPDTTTGFYVHAKVVVADYGLSTQNVYMGSINYSSASMNQNRELGMYLSDNAAVQTLYTTLTSDYNGGAPW